MSNDLSESDTFALLADRRRRLLLRLLRDSDTQLTVTELAERIRERDESSSRDPTSIRPSLCQDHLPQLAAADVVAYDETEGTVRPERNFERLVYLLEKAEKDELVRSER